MAVTYCGVYPTYLLVGSGQVELSTMARAAVLPYVNAGIEHGPLPRPRFRLRDSSVQYEQRLMTLATCEGSE